MSLDDENTTTSGNAPIRSGGGAEDQTPEHRHDGLMLAEPEVRTKRPPFFKVVLLNDDFTPMDFVVFLLKDVFHKNHEEAVSTMLDIHHKGAGIGGVFTRDVAETKSELVVTLARRNEYPLQCLVEKE